MLYQLQFQSGILQNYSHKMSVGLITFISLYYNNCDFVRADWCFFFCISEYSKGKWQISEKWDIFHEKLILFKKIYLLKLLRMKNAAKDGYYESNVSIAAAAAAAVIICSQSFIIIKSRVESLEMSYLVSCNDWITHWISINRVKFIIMCISSTTKQKTANKRDNNSNDS